MKLLLDMNIAPRWAEYLCTAGIQAIHWSRIGSANAPDADIMAYARTKDFIILTQDLDFTTLLAFTKAKKPSVVQLRSDDTRPESIGRHVIRALWQMKNELEKGALLSIDTNQARMRLLPL